MKKLKKIFISLFTLSLVLAMNVIPVMAEDSAGYKYTITLYAGNQGAINGVEGGMLKSTDLKYDAEVTFDLSKVTVTDDKYYVKGIRLSGRDNDDAAVTAPAFNVTGDADYVVAYGIKGDQVGYTVNYQDEAGNVLAPSSTFYGNIGDKPVVAYKYIENYVPQALAMTKTLSDNEADNVFTFVYRPVEPEFIDVREEGNITVVTNPAGGATTGAAVANGGAAGEGAGEGTAEGDVEVTEPEELVDLDDIETPTGNVDLDKKDSGIGGKGFPLVAAAVIGLGALAVLIALILIVRKRMKS